MTFWDRFYERCLEKGTKPNPLGKKIGIASSSITGWKSGKMPSAEAIVLVAKALDCSTDYLLGNSDIPTVSREYQEQDIEILDMLKELSESEKNFLIANLKLMIENRKTESK